MKRSIVLILVLLLPAASHAALLKYEVSFDPWSWPSELIDMGVYPDGTGYLITDTETNTIVGGKLKSDFFDFVWRGESEITQLGTYYDGPVVSGGSVNGIDLISGAEGYCDLTFWLPPGAGANYAATLDQHIPHGDGDIWSEMGFSGPASPTKHWDDFYLGLLMTVHSPTPVPAPSPFILLSLGLAVMAGVRFVRRRGDSC